MSEGDDLPQVPGYQLLRVIGSGGFGTVYEARELELGGRSVALKALDPGRLDARDRARFDRERAALGRLSGERHIVMAHHAGTTADGRPYVAMAMQRGGSLRDVLRARGRLPATQVVDLGLAVASALATAHEAGIVHRDVKPGNILVGDDGGWLLSDFGLATLVGATRSSSGWPAATVDYVAPELIAEEEPTPRTDLYSLGVTLYEAASGMRPFGSTRHLSPAVVVARIIAGDAPLLDASVPPALAEVIATAMARDPGRRYASAGALREALRRARSTIGGDDGWTDARSTGSTPEPPGPTADGPSAPRWRRRTAAAVLGVVVLGAGVATLAARTDDGGPPSDDEPGRSVVAPPTVANAVVAWTGDLGGGEVAAAAAGGGSLWLATTEGEVRQIDLDDRTDRALARSTERAAVGIAYVEGALWSAAADGSVAVVDASSGAALDVVGPQEPAVGIAAAAGQVAVLRRSGRVDLFDAATHRPSASTPLGTDEELADVGGIAGDGDELWVLASYDDLGLTVQRLALEPEGSDDVTGVSLPGRQSLDEGCGTVSSPWATGPGRAWLAVPVEGARDHLVECARGDGDLLAEVDLEGIGEVRALVHHAAELWVVGQAEAEVVVARVDPSLVAQGD